jgi:UDP-N-acetylglucosamine acyltransferase
MPIDPSAQIASTARVHPDAVIAASVVIGDYAVIEQDVVIGAGTRIAPHVYIKRWTTLGEQNEISAGTVLGTDPLDKGFKGDRSYLRIGHRNKIREHYTISRGTAPESETVIGNDNYVMTSGHIAHNARIGNGTIVASGALIAGYVLVEDQAFISGNAAIHQFSKVGRLAMVGGLVRVNKDLPPYFRYAGLYATVSGLNTVGLRRAGLTLEDRKAIKAAYKLLYRSGLKLTEALRRIEAEIPTAHTLHLVEFIRTSKRGISLRTSRGTNESTAEVDG